MRTPRTSRSIGPVRARTRRDDARGTAVAPATRTGSAEHLATVRQLQQHCALIPALDQLAISGIIRSTSGLHINEAPPPGSGRAGSRSAAVFLWRRDGHRMFGGVSSIPAIPLSARATSEFAPAFVSEGVLGVRAVLGAETAAAAAVEVDEALCAAQTRVEEQSDQDVRYFGPVRERTNRVDLRLYFRGALRAAVLELVAAVSPLLVEVVTDEALICELACIIADPGAPRQQLHADTKIDDRGYLVSIFVALQDVDRDMGGTVVIPSSHRASLHAEFKAERCSRNNGEPTTSTDEQEEWAVSKGAQRFEGRAGDALLFDSRVLHCGGANLSTKRRRMLYVTWRIPYCEPLGSTYSLLPEYEGQFRLRNLHRWRDPAEPANEDEVQHQKQRADECNRNGCK